MVSVFVPIIYLTVLMGGLGTFSYFYRRRQAVTPVSQLDEWFPPNTARDVYFSLQAQGDDVPTGILKSALLLRAVEDIKRLSQIQVRKNALNALMQKGGAGDDLWTRFLQLEEEMKAEVMDVVNEAGALQQDWNQIIFQTANEMWLNDQSREVLSKIMPMSAQIKQEYEGRKEVREEVAARVNKNKATRLVQEKEEAEREKIRLDREAEEQREKALQDLLAMEEKGSGSKSGSGTNSPKNKKKNK